MISKRKGLLICTLLLVNFIEAQKLTGKNSFLVLQFTSSQYPEAEQGFKNLSDKKYSYGFGLTYWKIYKPKIWVTAGFQGTFSDYAPLFVKDDIIGAAKFSSQLDAMVHLNAFKDDNPWNLFVGGGLGMGIFPGKFAIYTPLGTGISHYFSEGFRLIAQAQFRQPLTAGITKHYMHYSIGVAQTPPRIEKKKPEPLPEIAPVVAVTDKDQDGIVDSVDICPDEKGSLNGCPDRDGDLIADRNDFCPDAAGPERYKGCPIPDRDNDGVNDEEDKCPDTSGISKYAGCPPPDADGDGIYDEIDECPTVAGINALRGCPEIISVAKEKVKYAASNILFKFASDELLPSSFPALNEVVKIMKEEKPLKISIEAHADSIGRYERKMMWSELRAKSVANYFISKGIAAERISWKGYGDTKPIADNATEEGRAKNRRVELLIGY